MTYFYNGCIYITPKEAQIDLERYFTFNSSEEIYLGQSELAGGQKVLEITVSDYVAGDLSCELDNLLNDMLVQGASIVTDSYLDYVGDADGRFYFDGNQWQDLDISDAVIMDASDQTLLRELKSRGYDTDRLRCREGSCDDRDIEGLTARIYAIFEESMLSENCMPPEHVKEKIRA